MSTASTDIANGPKKGKKRPKGRTMALHEFHQTTPNTNPPKPLPGPTNSWADATDDIDPSDISTSWPTGETKTFDRSVLPSGPRASTAVKIDKSRLPSQPPYTVYLGNLSYECTEDDIKRFFERKKLVASSVRLPVDSGTNRMRGFGYAEFDTVDNLMEALSLDKETMRNRPVSVDIAGGRGGGGDYGNRRGGGDYGGGEDRTSGDWRRDGGREDDIESGGSPPGGRGDYRNSGPPSDRRYGGRNDYRNDYGDRGGDYGNRRDNYSDYRGGYDRDGGYGGRDDYSRRDGGYRGGGRRDYGRDDYGGERDYRGGGYDRGPPRSREYSRYRGDDDGRDSYRRDGGRQGYGRRGSPDYHRQEPVERRQIKLQPRTKPTEGAESTPSEEANSSNSIFGGAKPVDTAAREREIEEKLAKEEQLREEKIAREKELREQEERERQEKVAAVFGGAKPVDTAAREREIEEKMARKTELLEKQLSEREKSPEGTNERHTKTPDGKDHPWEGREGSHDKNEQSRDQRDSRDNRGSRGFRRRRISSSEEESRRSTGRGRGHNDEEGSAHDGGERREDRSSQERGDTGDKRRRGRGTSERRDDRRGYADRKDYHGDRGGRGRGRGNRSRDDRRDGDRGGERGGKSQTNARSKGKPRSLGNPDQLKKMAEPEQVDFAIKSRFDALDIEEGNNNSDSESDNERPPQSPAEIAQQET